MFISPQRRPMLSQFMSSKCKDCGCEILKGTRVWYMPPHLDIRGRPVVGYITHRDGECGMPYTVHLIYTSTRKRINVVAYHPDEAIVTAQKKAKVGGMAQPHPSGWEVWQGNVRVR